MVEQVNFNHFCDRFKSMSRDTNFSYEGKKALFDYLEQYEREHLGEEIELDVIALCCDYTEYEDLKAFQADYGKEYYSMEKIENATRVINIDGKGFIIQNI